MSKVMIDSACMRKAMSRYATGVAVVTTEHAGEPHGMTVNSLTSVSLDPVQLLVCFNYGARSAEAVTAAGMFAVNVLARRQYPIALRFAQRGEDHFAGLGLEYEHHRVPVVPNALAHLECEVDRVILSGDHYVVFGAVIAVCTREGAPLGFYRGLFSDITPVDHEPEHWFS